MGYTLLGCTDIMCSRYVFFPGLVNNYSLYTIPVKQSDAHLDKESTKEENTRM